MLPISQRKDLYRQLAAIFSYPGEELLPLLADTVRWEGLAAEFDLPLPAGWDAGPLTRLEEAFTALFDAGLGGAVAPPYGSVYLDAPGRLMGPSTRQVEAFYAEAGVTLEGTVEPADFLATELEFLYYLVDREAKAFGSKDLAGARTMTARQQRFLEQWLLPWLPTFVERLEARIVHPLYPWAAKLLLAFGRSELDWLRRLPPPTV